MYDPVWTSQVHTLVWFVGSVGTFYSNNFFLTKLKPEKTDLDVVVDVTLLLWKKCKDIFQKYQTGSQDNYRWVTKLENFSKVNFSEFIILFWYIYWLMFDISTSGFLFWMWHINQWSILVYQ